MEEQENRSSHPPLDEASSAASNLQPSTDSSNTPEGPSLEALELLEQPLEDALGFFDIPTSEGTPSSKEPAAQVPPEPGSTAPSSYPVPSTSEQPTADAGVSRQRKKPANLKIGVAGARHHRSQKASSTNAYAAAAGARKASGAQKPAPQGAADSRTKASVSKKTAGPKTRVGQEESQDQKKARKGALFMVGVLAAYALWIFMSGQFDEFVGALNGADAGWFVAGMLVMSFNFVFGALAFVLAAYIDPTSPLGVRDCMSVEANGVLFGNLTPMSTGTMPAQIYRLTQAGLDVGAASATQLTRFVIYQAGEVVVAATLLLLRFDFFLHTYGDIVFLNIVVFVIQTLQAAGLLVVCLFPRFVTRVGNWGLRFASRHGWFSAERVKRYSDVLNNQVRSFGGTFRDSFRHMGSLALTLLVTLGQMLCFYAVPWFVLRAFGGDADFVTCLAAASMVQMIGNSVPLPGGTGGNEAGFALFFGPIFGAAATAGFIVWRLITFFIPTLAAFPLMALSSSHNKSIYQRWQHFRTRKGRRAQVFVSRKK